MSLVMKRGHNATYSQCSEIICKIPFCKVVHYDRLGSKAVSER